MESNKIHFFDIESEQTLLTALYELIRDMNVVWGNGGSYGTNITT